MVIRSEGLLPGFGGLVGFGVWGKINRNMCRCWAGRGKHLYELKFGGFFFKKNKGVSQSKVLDWPSSITINSRVKISLAPKSLSLHQSSERFETIVQTLGVEVKETGL